MSIKTLQSEHKKILDNSVYSFAHIEDSILCCLVPIVIMTIMGKRYQSAFDSPVISIRLQYMTFGMGYSTIINLRYLTFAQKNPGYHMAIIVLTGERH